MSRRSLLLLPTLLAATALPVSPAFAGEDPGTGGGGPGAPVPSSSSLRVSQGCVTGNRAKLVVTGTNILSVKFYVAGKLIKTDTTPSSSGRFIATMRCSRVSVGAHRGRAVVSYSGGASATRRFQLTRASQTSPQFTG